MYLVKNRLTVKDIKRITISEMLVKAKICQENFHLEKKELPIIPLLSNNKYGYKR